MDFLPALLSGITSLVMFGCVAAGLMKIFQTASDVRELKDMVQEIKRNTQDVDLTRTASVPTDPLSPEALVRAVHAQRDVDSLTVDSPARPPRT